jgi:AcrR family transcriptional regulator
MTTISTNEEGGAAKRYHHGDLRRALLNAATAILERSGPEALSLRAVAREAGVSPAAPYHHFKDKDELVLAVAREGFQRLKSAIAQTRASIKPGSERSSDMGLAYIKFALTHPALYRVMYDSARREDAFPDDGAQDDSSFQSIHRAVQAMRGPEISETEVHLAAIAGWCLAHGLAEMRGFAQFKALKDQLGGEEAFLRGVLEHIGTFSQINKPVTS